MTFDPQAFIAAERAQRETLAATLAETLADEGVAFEPEKGQGFRRFKEDRDRGLATLATLAGPHAADEEIAGHLRSMAKWPTPHTMGDKDWDRLTWVAAETWDRWGAEGLAAGWTALEIFGCCADIEARRVDMDGVVVGFWRFHEQFEITAVTNAHWTFTGPRGSILRHYRMTKPAQVPLWVAYAPPDPP